MLRGLLSAKSSSLRVLNLESSHVMVVASPAADPSAAATAAATAPATAAGTDAGTGTAAAAATATAAASSARLVVAGGDVKLLAAARGCLGAVLASELLRHAPSPLPTLYELGLRGCGLRAACVPPLCRAVAMLRTLQRLDLRDNPQLLGHDDADQAGTIATADGGTAAAVHLGTLCLHAPSLTCMLDAPLQAAVACAKAAVHGLHNRSQSGGSESADGSATEASPSLATPTAAKWPLAEQVTPHPFSGLALTEQGTSPRANPEQMLAPTPGLALTEQGSTPRANAGPVLAPMSLMVPSTAERSWQRWH